MRNYISLLVLVLSLVLCVVHIAFWYPALPDLVPIHFDADGLPNPNSLTSRNTFVILFLGVHFLGSGFLVGIAFALKYLPKEMLNIPNKEYWLSDERCEETLEVNRIALFWIAIATNAFFVLIFELSALVGIEQRNSLGPGFVIGMVLYLGFVFGVCGYLMYRFRIPETDMDSVKSL